MELVTPDYQDGGILGLVSSILSGFGLEPPGSLCRDDILPLEIVSNSRAIVLLVCDALGHRQLETVLERGMAPNIAGLISKSEGGLQQLTSVFPATTTTALTTLTTGLRPSEHGILGFRLWLEEAGTVYDMISLRPVDGATARFSWQSLRKGPTIYERLARRSVRSFVIGPNKHANSDLTRLLYAGAQYLGYLTPSEIPGILRESLERREKKRTFYFVYWPALDDIAHKYGVMSEPYVREIEELDLWLAELQQCCADHGTTLVLTSDHGQVNLAADRAIVIDEEISKLLSNAPGGDRRVAYLSSDSPAALANHQRLQHEAIMVIPSEEAIAKGWFGGACDEFRSRLGDLILMALGDRQILYDYGRGLRPLAASHAGLTQEEMLVPLIVRAYR